MRQAVRAGLCGFIAAFCACAAPVTAMNEQSIRDYYAAWSTHNVEAVLTYFNDDAVYEDVATGERATGKAEMRAFIERILVRNPNLRIDVTSITLGGSRAAVEWVMKGGGGDHAWAVRGASILELRDAHIARATDYWHAGG